MPENHSASIQLLEHLLCRRLEDSVPDGTLLDRFVRLKDEAAFTTLVARHGPMVLRLCRRVLGDAHAAEDAFQATFLVLARRAAAVRRPESLAAWLLAVAARVSRKALRAQVRCRGRETPASGGEPPDPQPDPLAEVTARELLGILEEELQRLPEVYRLPLILCCLEGCTQEEAARLLGWSAGSVKGRLERGRARLHARLVRRGFSLSAALGAATVSGTLTAATMTRVTAEAVQAALARGASTSARVLALAQGGLPALALARVQFGVLVLLLGALAVGVGLAAHGTRGEEKPAVNPEPGTLPAGAVADRAKGEEPRADRRDASGVHLPAGAHLRLGTTWLKHRDRAIAAACSPDGKLLATSGDDRCVRVWDLQAQRQLYCLSDLAYLDVLVFSPDSKTLVAASRSSRTGCVYDSATGKKRTPLLDDDPRFDTVAFTPDGRTLVTTGGFQHAEWTLWDVATGQVRQRLKDPEDRRVLTLHDAVFAPDGKTVVSIDDSPSVRVWDAAGKVTRRFALGPAKEPHESRWMAVLSRDGKSAAIASELLGVRVWDVTSGKERFALPRGFGPPVIFSADGTRCACLKPGTETGADSVVVVLDTATGEVLGEAKDSRVNRMTFFPDGRTLATIGDRSFVRLWDLAGKERPRAPEHRQAARFVGFSPSGRTLATVGDDRTLQLWDTDTGRHLRTFSLAPNEWHQGRFAVFAPDGRTISAPGDFFAFDTWEVDSGKTVKQINYGPYVGAVVDSPDGRLRAVEMVEIVGDVKSRPIRLLETVSGREVVSFRSPWVREYTKPLTPGRLAFAADGSLLAVTDFDRSVRLYDTRTGKEVRTIEDAQQGVRAVAFSPSGRMLATCCSRWAGGWGWEGPASTDYNAVRLWDAATGEMLREMLGHTAGVATVAFSPDGRVLASGGDDGTVRLWETATGREFVVFHDQGNKVHHVAFAPDGTRLASAMTDGSALVWEVKPAGWAPPREGLTEAEMERLWADLGGADGPAAYRAVWTLAAAPEAVPFLARRLKPVPPVDPERIRSLIAALDHEDFQRRQGAARELAEWGTRAEMELRKALQADSAEVRAAANRLLQGLSSRSLAGDMTAQRPLRAVWVLERSGTPQARKVLEALAGGAPEDRLTAAAKGARERLAGRPAVNP